MANPETAKAPAAAKSASPAAPKRGPAPPKKAGSAPPQKGRPTRQAAPPEYFEEEKGWFGRNWIVITVYSVSTLVHLILFVICYFIVIEGKAEESGVAIVSTEKPLDENEDDDFEPIEDPQELTENEETDSNVDDVAAEAVADTPSPVDIDIDDLDPSIMMQTIELAPAPAIKISDKFGGRSEAARKNSVAKNGGSAASEAAVGNGLKWLASVQKTDGSWNFTDIGQSNGAGTINNPMGATGLALMAFLGAGHTPVEGKYKSNVGAGLTYLLQNMKITSEGGDLRGTGAGNMYVQGICTIALSEAYGMLPAKSRYRKQLKVAAEQAVLFIVRAQDPNGGGWRYRPRQPGDTSVVGWQMAALKSAYFSGIPVPRTTMAKASYFLDTMTNDGAKYGYANPAGKPSTTAVGLLCRLYTGWNQNNDGLVNGVAYLAKVAPQQNNMYFNYYATQVLFFWGGEEWKKWNAVMREHLIRTQTKGDGPDKGSWHNPQESHGSGGGRLYTTCMSIMILEVYYRHLPLYKRDNVLDKKGGKIEAEKK